MTDKEIEYKMKSDLFSFQELKTHKDFTVLRLGDSVYMGSVTTNEVDSVKKRHGRGIMKYKNRLYEGFWLNDLRHGEGFEVYKNKNYYLGSFKNGKIV
jgi:hypothetical protein